jgi:hypothetical protein
VDHARPAREAQARPPRRPRPAPPPAATPASLVALGRLAGNAAVAGLVGRAGPHLQRVAFSATRGETLLTTEVAGTGPPTGFTAHGYSTGGSNTYEMTREGNAVKVKVKILFLDPAGTVIPTTEPANRRGTATQLCRDLVGFWNNKFQFTTEREEAPPPAPAPAPAGQGAGSRASAPGGTTPPPVNLDVVFEAEPLFEGSGQNATVYYHSNIATGQAPAGGPYGIVDAANWFQQHSPQAYGTTPLPAVYAHEYGHLIGIPDEYSVANPEMHRLFHEAAPGAQGQAMGEELDRQGARRVMIDALTPYLARNVRNLGQATSRLILAQRPAMANDLARAVRAAWRDDSLVTNVGAAARAALPAGSRVARHAPEAVRFEATENLSYLSVANEALDTQIQPGPLSNLLVSMLHAAIRTAMGTNVVTIPFHPGRCSNEDFTVRIDTTALAQNATLVTAAQAAADAAVGLPPAMPGRGAPRISPSPDLMGRMAQTIGRWQAARDLFGTQVAGIADRVRRAALAAFAGPGATFAADVGDSVPRLYRAVLERFLTIARSAAAAAVDEFLNAGLGPVMGDQMQELHRILMAELDNHTSVPLTGGTNAAPGASPPDPQVLARANAIHQQMQVMATQARTEATAGAPTMAPGATQATTTRVRYTMNTMMGDTHTSDAASNPAAQAAGAVRPAYLNGILANFNRTRPALRHDDEPEFAVRRKR